MDRLGFYCRPRTGIKVKNDGTDATWVGGSGGKDFSDKALSVDYRIVSIKIRSADELDSIQVTYGTTKITGKLCTNCKSEQTMTTLKYRYLFIHFLLKNIKRNRLSSMVEMVVDCPQFIVQRKEL